MCNILKNFNLSLNNDKILKILYVVNVIIFSVFILIIISSIFSLISFDYSLISQIGYISFINNVFLSILGISLIGLVEYYRTKNFLIKDKKTPSFFILFFCIVLGLIKLLSSLGLLLRFKSIKNREIKNLLIIIYIIFSFYVLLEIFLIIDSFLLQLMKKNIIRMQINNRYISTNESNISTKPDIIENSNEILIDNYHNKDMFFYISQKVINNVQKEFINKEIQTIININNKSN